MWILGGNGPSQGTDAVLAVPFSQTVIEIGLYRTVVSDAVLLQKIPYILDAYVDVCYLNSQRHALLYARIYWLEIANP